MQFVIGFVLGLVFLGCCWFRSARHFQRLVANAQSRLPALHLLSENSVPSLEKVLAFINEGQPLKIRAYYDDVWRKDVNYRFIAIEPVSNLPYLYRFTAELVGGGQILRVDTGYLDYGPLIFVSAKAEMLAEPAEVYIWRELASDQMARIRNPHFIGLLPPLPQH